MKQCLAEASKVVLLAIGSELRGDDAAGILVFDALAKLKIPRLHALNGATAPENLTGEVKRQNPSHLLIVDAAQLGAPPGTVRLVPVEDIGGYSFSTHALPLKVLVDFLRQDISSQVFVVAIQPKDVAFGAPVSPEVKAAASLVAEAIRSALKG
jgi:hydrogenase 3 maturation protease